MAHNFWFPWQLPPLNTTFSKLTTKKQCFFSVFIIWAVFQLQWQKKTYLKHRPLFCLQIFKFSNFQILLWHPRLTFDWLSVSFFDYWPIRMSHLLLSLHWINPLPHWINSLPHWITWKLHLSLTNQSWVIFPCILLKCKVWTSVSSILHFMQE